MFWAVFPADPIESGIVPGVANTQQMEQIVPRSPTNEESVGNSFMPWSKILKTPKFFGRNLINHHPPSSSKCSSLSSSSRPLSVPFLFRTSGYSHSQATICDVQGGFLNWSARFSVPKWKKLLSQRGAFLHWKFCEKLVLVGCNLFLILVLKIGRTS